MKQNKRSLKDNIQSPSWLLQCIWMPTVLTQTKKRQKLLLNAIKIKHHWVSSVKLAAGCQSFSAQRYFFYILLVVIKKQVVKESRIYYLAQNQQCQEMTDNWIYHIVISTTTNYPGHMKWVPSSRRSAVSARHLKAGMMKHPLKSNADKWFWQIRLYR